MVVMSSMVGIAALLREADAHELELRRGEVGEPGEGRPGEAAAAPGEGRPGEATQREEEGKREKGEEEGTEPARHRWGSAAPVARVGTREGGGDGLALLATGLGREAASIPRVSEGPTSESLE
jgi:hypothetical protein